MTKVECLTQQIGDLAQNWSHAPVVAALQAMRGVAFIVAVTLAAEVGDFSRFANPRQLMAYLGLVLLSIPADAQCIEPESPKPETPWRAGPRLKALGRIACKRASVANCTTVSKA